MDLFNNNGITADLFSYLQQIIAVLQIPVLYIYFSNPLISADMSIPDE